jgi:1,4-alpha-glucan branching enzyme
MMAQGYLALVLHAHLPFVRHPESETYLEERWLFEAMTETYIPLLMVYQRLLGDGVPFRMTMSVSPTLLTMLTDPLLQSRYARHLDKLIELAEREVMRTKDEPALHRIACEYRDRFLGLRLFYRQYGGNLVTAFRELEENGVLELITSAATHAFLPLVMTEEAVRAQIRTAVDLHERHFGRKPRGIWLPECGWRPELDRILKECGLIYTFVDSHGVGLADPKPVFGTMSPVLTPHGIAVFPRDQESSKQVWSAQEGYPGDHDYREYYRDIGYDLDFDLIKDYVHPDGIRINTGIKYHRITGQGEYKEWYNPDWAREKAAQHAGNFLFNREKQIEHWQGRMGRKPIIVSPYDAELFGHWWYEGPLWLDLLLRKLHYDQSTVKTITPSEYLALYADFQVCSLPMSSWGRAGFADVWLCRENDWIYPALHRMEERMIELATHFAEPSTLERRALNQAARELMLAESSDWAFIMDSKTMVEYAVKRTKQHVNRFDRLYEMLRAGKIEERWLSDLELLDNLFPEIDYTLYRATHIPPRSESLSIRPRVLMLSWEFPPMTVGGLSRHVYDLSRYLVKNGWDVHVLTMEAPGAPMEEIVEGVHVHRVHVMKPDGGEFIHWVLQLNLMMIDAAEKLIEHGLHVDVVHAHDWLVCYAAKELKDRFGLPLVATIHATEHGRNHGIHTDLQRKIHSLEWQLTYLAQRVILCSTYMRREVESLFQLPADKLDVIPNGVDPHQLIPSDTNHSQLPYLAEGDRVVLFVGRLVHEKGVHTLLEAAPAILAEHPDVKFVIAGRGPSWDHLHRLVREFGLERRVHFTGFVADEERNHLLHTAKVAVFPSLYEPFGIVALEAMAAGTPVVVSDVGGLADVVQHGHNGLKAYPNDPASLALQVKELLRRPDDAAKLAAVALGEIGRFDWNRIAEQTIAVYQNVLHEREAEGKSEQLPAPLSSDL